MISTNIAVTRPDPGGKARVSGIDKRPEAYIDVSAPGPNYGDGSSVDGDVIGSTEHHGGAQKAVYAYAREELDWWGDALGRTFLNGYFGENLTTSNIDLEHLLVNQRVRVGTAVLDVSIVRQPCRTFASWLGESGWVKRFSHRGRCGTYFRVVTPGRIAPGDTFEFLEKPAHDIDILTAFRAAQGDKVAARRVVEAGCLPALYHERLVTLITT